MSETVICPYCGGDAKLIRASSFYRGSPKLALAHIWRCDPCDAHVGCHRESRKEKRTGTEPLGSLANKNLRVLRDRAHRAFDPLWRTERKFPSRSVAYRWLAEQFGETEVHIAQMRDAECQKVIDLCERI